MSEPKLTYGELEKLAKDLAISLAYEIMWLEDHPHDDTLDALAEARKSLGLEEEFDDMNSLIRKRRYDS